MDTEQRDYQKYAAAPAAQAAAEVTQTAPARKKIEKAPFGSPEFGKSSSRNRLLMAATVPVETESPVVGPFRTMSEEAFIKRVTSSGSSGSTSPQDQSPSNSRPLTPPPTNGQPITVLSFLVSHTSSSHPSARTDIEITA
jgi:hypothetical protein